MDWRPPSPPGLLEENDDEKKHNEERHTRETGRASAVTVQTKKKEAEVVRRPAIKGRAWIIRIIMQHNDQASLSSGHVTAEDAPYAKHSRRGSGRQPSGQEEETGYSCRRYTCKHATTPSSLTCAK